MASALQCIMHVQQLVTYFVSDQYKFEVNTDNPLGYNGDIANAFACLIKQIYSVERFSSVRPANLKKVLGKYNEQFGGFNQQDAQELLAFLMDGIHEDLNRVLKKQPTEKVEGTDFDSDEAAATEALARHHKRHQSIIVDLFQGQYKSTVICSVCNSRFVVVVFVCCC
jgi:ubiquitin C-terminal hydrolase